MRWRMQHQGGRGRERESSFLGMEKHIWAHTHTCGLAAWQDGGEAARRVSNNTHSTR